MSSRFCPKGKDRDPDMWRRPTKRGRLGIPIQMQHIGVPVFASRNRDDNGGEAYTGANATGLRP